jgi:hypothetical protein
MTSMRGQWLAARVALSCPDQAAEQKLDAQ